MKTNQLKLGNYFTYDKKLVYIAEILKDQTVTIYDGHGLDLHIPLSLLRPILLKNDDLVLFGFDEADYKDGFIGIDFNGTSFALSKPTTNDKFYKFHFTHGGIHLFNQIKFVHELQNFYFEITNQKLTRKSTCHT